MRLLAPLLVVLASSCGGLTTKLCGAPGQPCCAEAACDVGALCGAGQLCEACGGEGQRCCADAACGEPLTCISGACVQGVSCVVQCTLGASRCASGGVETCRAAGVCPDWQLTVTACPPGADCVATGETADCVERCPGACPPDTLLCTNVGLQTCVAVTSCPALVSQPDDIDVPQCLTGAIVNAEFVWESPTPVGASLVDIAGELQGSYWVLDVKGNIIRYALGPWEYEVRATPGRRMRALASCGLGSRLYAVGEAGTVMRRAAGEWLEESVGTTTDLVDVVCDVNRAYAVGADSRLYVRDGTGWSGSPIGVTADYSAMANLFAQSEVYLSGPDGLVVRCNVAALPPTCTVENTGSAADLYSIWGDGISNTIYAVGAAGTLLQKGATWQTIPLPGVTEPIVAVSGIAGATDTTYMVAVTAAGQVVVRKNESILGGVVQLPTTFLTNVWVPDLTTLVVTGASGELWYRGGVENPSTFVARGGRKPVHADLRAVTSIGQGRLFAVGDLGTRVRRQNGAWVADEQGFDTTAQLLGVAARSAGEIYAVGEGGTVLVRRWGTWGREAVGLTSELLSAVAMDDTRVWALAKTGLLEKDLRTGAWRRIDFPAGTLRISAMALRKDAQGRAVELSFAGSDCTVLAFDPAGGTFSALPRTQACGNSHDFTAAAYLASGDLMLATFDRVLFRRSGGSLTRENLAGSLLSPLNGLVVDGASMWAVGDNGTILRRVTTSWVDALPEVSDTSFAAGVKDDEGLFFVGSAGAVLRRL